VLADDAVLLREGLASLLERFGHTVAAAVGDAGALLAAAEHRPDPVITDVRMPPTHTDEGRR
jgi:CheY-like chemotaxis protein